MSGVKGRSGRKPLPLAQHILAGTYRRDRHGALPETLQHGATVLQMPAVFPKVPKAVSAGLGRRGRAFIEDLWVAYGEWSPAALVLLRQAGQLVDAVEAYQTTIARETARPTARGTTDAHPLLRAQHLARGRLLNVIAALRLKD